MDDYTCQQLINELTLRLRQSMNETTPESIEYLMTLLDEQLIDHTGISFTDK